MIGVLAVLVGTGWTISLLVCTNWYRKTSLTLYGAQFLALSGQTFDVQTS